MNSPTFWWRKRCGGVCSSSQKQVCFNLCLLPKDDSLRDCCPHTSGLGKEGVKAGLIPPVQIPRGKCPSLRPGPSAGFLLPVLNSHELAPAGSPLLPATLPSLQVCSLLLPAETSVSVVAWSQHCCGQLLLGGIAGIKMLLPGSGPRVASAGRCPAPPY